MLNILLAAMLLLNTLPAVDGNPSKVNEVLIQVKQGKTGSEPEHLMLMENDVNAWLGLVVQNRADYGVQKAAVDFLGDDRIAGTAEIDMDKVRLEGYTAQLFQNLVTGVQTVVVTGLLQCQDGRGQFTVEEASLNGVTVPAALVEQILSYASSRQPPNVDITEPFRLPPDVKSVKVLTDRIVIER